jgi:hypothetical protein
MENQRTGAPAVLAASDLQHRAWIWDRTRHARAQHRHGLAVAANHCKLRREQARQDRRSTP